MYVVPKVKRSCFMRTRAMIDSQRKCICEPVVQFPEEHSHLEKG